MSDTFNINGRTVGDGNPAYIIAEMSANHAGSIERALELIHVAKEAGADCVKIQTYTPDTMTIDCRIEYFQIEKGTWEDDNLYSLYQKAYTPWEWQEQLRDEAAKVGIDFLSTPFDHTSVDFLENLGVGFYKIASFELVDIPLLEYISSKKKPIIMSTAMGTLEEINEAVAAIYRTGNKQLALMKCSSAYPAKSEEMNLSTIRDLKARFNIPIGLSDHSMGYFSAATAVAMGANIIEKHFCISRAIKNPDSSFSMEPEEFREMVCQVREVEKAMGKVYYGVSEQEESNA
ncbi:MAG: pseudaminic acid synthase, partial [Lachnospiraceae bacterium]|nr:pseudaminic acid synthase [Lachnospiraceae bacterium]